MNRSTFAAAALVALAPALAVLGPTAGAAPSSADARAAAPYRVIAKINRTEAIAGEDTVRITGRVKPAAVGELVVLQQRIEGRKGWKRSGTARIKANGTFVLKDDPSTRGVRSYRVVKPAGDGVAAGRSAELELEVWGWSKLAQRAVGANQGMYNSTTVAFGTDLYSSSLAMHSPGMPGYIEYTLGDKCRTLKATYALTDSSETGATGAITVTVDGAAKATHGLGTGVIVRDHVVDVTDAFRIRFDANGSASPRGTAAVGTPMVLCLT